MKYIFILLNLINIVSACNVCLSNECPDNCDHPMWKCEEDKCVHKDLFPFNAHDAGLTICVIFLSIFAAIAGIGGGGVLIPIYMLIGSFGTYYAIPLTVITIAGSSLIRMFVLVNKKNPNNYNRFLIDYRIILLFVPFDGNTSFIGFLINSVTPNIFTIIITILLLGAIAYNTIKKGLESYKKENENINGYNFDRNLVYCDGIYFPIEKKTVEIDGIELEINSEEYKKVFNKFAGNKPYDRIKYFGALGVVFGLFIMFTMTRNELIERCEGWYWGNYVFQFLTILTFGIFIAKHNIESFLDEQNQGLIPMEGDIVWDKKNDYSFSINRFYSWTRINIFRCRRWYVDCSFFCPHRPKARSYFCD